jgi:hypothetical protein
MDRAIWKGRIQAALSDMADEQFQRRAWTGIGPEVSSLVEVICGLFDDALLREYVEKYTSTLAPKTLSDVRDLDRKIQSLDTDHLDTLPVLEVIDSPQWVEIRDMANGLKLAFEQDRNPA